MNIQFLANRTATAALLAALSLMLTSCFVTPGKFDSTLVINQDNSFDFFYNGEFFFMALSPAAMTEEDGGIEFYASDCYDDQNNEERECTADELAEQQAEWETDAEERARNRQEEAKKMAALMGGVDPSDPEAGNKLATMLNRQRGWNKVVYAGEGVFNVEYAISGHLSHDLTFPVIEGVPLPSPFIQVISRKGNQVRINAPGFAAQEGGNAMTGVLMGGFARGWNEAVAEKSKDGSTGIPQMKGIFRVVTNGRILANNTDEGPSQTAQGKMLVWDISPTTSSAPTALIELSD